MHVYVDVLMSVIVLFFLASGIVLKKRGFSEEAQGKGKTEADVVADRSRERSFIGTQFIVISGILLLSGVLDHYHVIFGFVLSIASLFFMTAFILIRIFRMREKVVPGKADGMGLRILLGVVVAGLFLVGVILVYGSIEQTVWVGRESVEISGLYGTSINTNDITEVSMIYTLPRITGKRFGFDFGRVMKGDFALSGLGEGKLYLSGRTPPFLCIRYRDTYALLSFKDSTATRKLYEELKDAGAHK